MVRLYSVLSLSAGHPTNHSRVFDIKNSEKFKFCQIFYEIFLVDISTFLTKVCPEAADNSFKKSNIFIHLNI